MTAFTPAQIWAVIIAVIGLILSVLNIIDKIISFNTKAKAPQKSLESRILKLEEWSTVIERRLNTGDKHFEKVDRGNNVTQKALLAIMDHAINGNNVDELKEARDDLYDYLTDKGGIE